MVRREHALKFRPGQGQTVALVIGMMLFVGDMAIISHEPPMASLVTAADVRTQCVDRTQLDRVLWERPETNLAVMWVLIARLKENQGVAGPRVAAGPSGIETRSEERGRL